MIADKLEITKLQPSKMLLGMTDSYTAPSLGFILDLPVQIENYIIPTDF